MKDKCTLSMRSFAFIAMKVSRSTASKYAGEKTTLNVQTKNASKSLPSSAICSAKGQVTQQAKMDAAVKMRFSIELGMTSIVCCSTDAFWGRQYYY